MKIKPRLLAFAFLLMQFADQMVSTCSGQQVIWANKNNMDKRTDFTKVVGQNKFGVYVLKHKNSTFRRYYILEHFDKKMNLLKSKTFKIPNAELEKIVVHTSGITVFTKEYIKGQFSRLLYQSIDSGLNDSPVKEVFVNKDNRSEITSLRIEYNQRRDKFLVWYIREAGENASLNYILMSKKTSIREGNYTIASKAAHIFVGDAIIDDTGNLYLMYTRSEKFKSKLASDFEHKLLAINIYQNEILDKLVNNEKTFLSTYKLVYNPDTKTVDVFGLTGELDEDDNKGYFAIRINCSDLSLMSTTFNDIGRDLVSKIIGVKGEQKGDNLNKFKIKKLIPKTDGGFVAICERIFITTQSDIFYVNGIPQSSYARIFNNDEVVIMNIDSVGKVLWTEIISKNQSSYNDGGYYNGIIIMVNENEINILYNDKLNINADIIQVTFKPNGEHSKKILINNEQYYAMVIPSEYNQVSSNSIVIPINQNRDFTYIKLLY